MICNCSLCTNTFHVSFDDDGIATVTPPGEPDPDAEWATGVCPNRPWMGAMTPWLGFV